MPGLGHAKHEQPLPRAALHQRPCENLTECAAAHRGSRTKGINEMERNKLAMGYLKRN